LVLKLYTKQPANEISATLPQTIPAIAPPEIPSPEDDPASTVESIGDVDTQFLSASSS